MFRNCHLGTSCATVQLSPDVDWSLSPISPRVVGLRGSEADGLLESVDAKVEMFGAGRDEVSFSSLLLVLLMSDAIQSFAGRLRS